MKKTLLMSVLMLVGLAASAQYSVDPPQGRVNLSPNVNPLGCKQITIHTGEVDLNPDCKGEFCIYYEESEAPTETLPGTSATLDAMTFASVTFSFKGDYTNPGTYRVTIPEGVWFSNGTPNPAFELKYYIVKDFVITPVSGSVATSFNEWIVEATEAQEIDCKIPPTIMMRGTSTWQTLNTEVIREDGVNPNRLRMWVYNPVTTPGTILMQIEEGAFRFTTYGPNYANDPRDVTVSSSNETRLMYHVATTPKLEIAPPEGDIESVYEFSFTMPEGFGLIMTDSMVTNKFFKVDTDGDNIDDICTLKPFNFSAPSITACDPDGLKASEPIVLEPGRYALQLGEGLFFGQYNGVNLNTSPFVYYYNVPLKIFDATIDPADGTVLPRVDAFTMCFDKAEYLNVNEAEGAPVAYIEKDGEKLSNNVKLIVDEGISPLSAENPIKVAVAIEPAITDKGSYRLVLPEGCFTSGKDLSPEYVYNYICDGSQTVDGLEAEAQSYDIYTLSGIFVARGVDSSFIETLPEGLYIINGQKRIIRK